MEPAMQSGGFAHWVHFIESFCIKLVDVISPTKARHGRVS